MIDLEAMPFMADIPRHQASIRGADTAFWFEGKETSFSELDNRASQIANGLISANIAPNTRLGYLAKNTSSYYEILFGCAKARAVLNGVNTRLAPPEVQFILNDAQCQILFVGAEFYALIDEIRDELPHLSQIIALDDAHNDWPRFEDWRDQQSQSDPFLPIEPDDDVIQLYTSGTTGLPKGVRLTNANYASNFSQSNRSGWASFEPGSVSMNAMPLFHVAGVNVGVMGAAQGAKTLILRDINPAQILDLIEEHKVNFTFWVPAVILMLTQIPNVRERDFSSLNRIAYGASPITESLLNDARDIFACDFIQLFGLTETTGAATYLPPEAHNPEWGKLRSCGIPWPGAIIRCVDAEGQSVPTGEIGEIIIKSPFVMKGYWNRPEATEEAIKDGFFYTGDAGYFDEDGYLFIHDRIKDMIVSGGENIYPAEVEKALFGHPGIADVAVIGVPDEKWGESVKAIIVPKEDSNPSAEEIIAYARDRIAAFKCPKSVDYIDALPRNPSGKILRKDLREPYWKDRERRVS